MSDETNKCAICEAPVPKEVAYYDECNSKMQLRVRERKKHEMPKKSTNKIDQYKSIIWIIIRIIIIILIIVGIGYGAYVSMVATSKTQEPLATESFITIINERNLLLLPLREAYWNKIINSGATVTVIVKASSKIMLGIFLVDNKTGSMVKRITPYPPEYVLQDGYFDFRTDSAGIYRFRLSHNQNAAVTVYEFSVTVTGYRAEQVIDVAKGRVPSSPRTFGDARNDLVLDGGSERPSGTNLAPVDVIEVDISNDGKSIIIQIKTAGAIPKAYRDRNGDGYYVFTALLQADNDPNKSVDLHIISTEIGWDFWVNFVDAKDILLIKYNIEDDTVKFTIPLLLSKFGGQIDELGIRVTSGYEVVAGPILKDYLPDQSRDEMKFLNYRLWADSYSETQTKSRLTTTTPVSTQIPTAETTISTSSQTEISNVTIRLEAENALITQGQYFETPKAKYPLIADDPNASGGKGVIISTVESGEELLFQTSLRKGVYEVRLRILSMAPDMQPVKIMINTREYMLVSGCPECLKDEEGFTYLPLGEISINVDQQVEVQITTTSLEHNAAAWLAIDFIEFRKIR